MPPCPPGTIRNPASKRCVDVNGAVGKKLVKSYMANEIQLADENVNKLKEMGMAAAAVAPCPPDKIRNPKTKRCVQIDGPLGKALIKEYKEKKIELEANNVAKLGAVEHVATPVMTPAVAPVLGGCHDVNQIVNPATGYCVSIHGPVGKKLIKDYINKKVQLNSADVTMLEAIGIIPSGDVPKGSCKNNLKIKNPSTGMCVDINGPIGKKLIKQHKNKEITLQAQDVALLVKMGFLPSPVAEVPADPAVPLTLPNKILKALKDKAKVVRTRMQFQYVNEDHKQDCKTKNAKDIKRTVDKNILKLKFNRVKGTDIAANEPLQFYKQDYAIETAYNNLNKDFALRLVPDIDMEWFKKCNEYIEKLSIEDFYSVRQYTGVGDRVINAILRKMAKPSSQCFPVTFFCGKEYIMSPEFVPSKYVQTNISISIQIPDLLPLKLYTTTQLLDFLHTHGNLLTNQQFHSIMVQIYANLNVKYWTKCVELYVERLNTIIRNSPPVTKKMTVWRGVKDTYFLKGSKKNVFKNMGFISTSLNPRSAKVFTAGRCCLKKITLLPGTKALFIGGMSGLPHEFEVLLPEDTIYYLLYGRKTFLTYIDNITAASNVCGKHLQKLFVTEAVVIK